MKSITTTQNMVSVLVSGQSTGVIAIPRSFSRSSQRPERHAQLIPWRRIAALRFATGVARMRNSLRNFSGRLFSTAGLSSIEVNLKHRDMH